MAVISISYALTKKSSFVHIYWDIFFTNLILLKIVEPKAEIVLTSPLLFHTYDKLQQLYWI